MRYLAITLPLLVPALVLGQSDHAKSDQGLPATQLSADEQRELVDSIFQSTKSARDATDYTLVITSCGQAIDRGLSDDNIEYLNNVMSWAYNRRGAARLRVMDELMSVGNDEQALRASEKARSDLLKSLELDKNRWRAQLNLGVLHARLGQYSKAVEKFSRVIEFKPGETNGAFNRAECNYALQEYDAALTDYDRVLNSSPGDLQALTGRGHTLFHLNRLSDAKSDYDVVVKMRADDSWARANRGDLHLAMGNWSAAYDDYTAAVKLEPAGGIYQRTAWMLATCPESDYYKPQLALQLAHKAIELAGETADNLDTLAAAQAANGEFKAAQKTQARAVALADSRKSEFQKRMAMYDNSEAFQQTPEKVDSNGTIIR